MRWHDIPKIERWGKSFTIPWNNLEEQLATYEEDKARPQSRFPAWTRLVARTANQLR